MRAGVDVLTTDGAHAPFHAAPHAHFLFDAALDLRDQRIVLAAAQHIRIALEIAAPLALRANARLLHDLRAIDARRLSPRRPFVVEDAALAYKQFGQLFKRRAREALAVPVHLVVAQPHGKGVDLVLFERALRELIDDRQFLARHHAVFEPIALFSHFHAHFPSASSFSCLSFRACCK